MPSSSVLRPRSVRAKIVALLMLPVVSLMALWGFAAVTTASGIGDAERGKDVNAELLTPVGEFVTAVQGERTAALGKDAAAYRRAQAATDRTAAAVRAGVDSVGSDAGLLDAALPGRLAVLKSDTGALEALRARPSYAGYSAIVRHGFAVRGALADSARSADASDGRVLLELARAREAVAQERALLADGVLGAGEYAEFVGAVAVQRELLEAGVADLKAEHRGEYRRVLLELARAREAVAQERALLADGVLGAGEYAEFVGAVAVQRELL
ncbi:MAG TPA: nitrate- and nitrite sensing domain-containing protein, partial [Streptomyces sp.]